LRRQGRLGEATASFTRATYLKRASPWLDPAAPTTHDGSPTFTTTSEAKLSHDIEQLRFLRRRGRLPAQFDPIVARYEATLAEIHRDTPNQHVVALPPAARRELGGVYNRLLYLAPTPALDTSPLSAHHDVPAIELRYRADGLGTTCIDDFLTPASLASLRQFCLESTLWFGFKHAGGYLGAYMEQGFCCDLLVQIAEELRRRFPNIFRHHLLSQMWAYKYDSRHSGIGIHADFAAVNVNFWITPDDANLNPDGGGLEVFLCEAPPEWHFTEYNGDTAHIREFLATQRAGSVVIPHRQNRAVIFNSNLFHKTGAFHFKPGYTNRRINITMLFGERQPPSGAAG
jgi:hypothetical protein